ncbi:diguanylate cyclase [Mycoplasmatota bacterium]|nr:diguanylate cyclase [Mycoplasmatota bacterium]
MNAIIKKFHGFYAKYMHSNLNQSTLNNFEDENNLVILNRIKLLSKINIIFSFYYVYGNLKLFEDISDKGFIWTNIIIEAIGVVVSIIYLLLYNNYFRNDVHVNKRLVSFVLWVFPILFLGLGTAFGLNSQRITGSIDSYIIFVMITAFIFTIKPLYIIIVLIIYQLIFLFGLSQMNQPVYISVTNKIYTSGFVLFAILINVSQYKLNINQFNNNAKLQVSEQNFRKLFDINPYPLFIVRHFDGLVIESNKNAINYFEINPENMNDLKIDDIFIYPKEQEIMEKLKQQGHAYNHVVEIKVDKVYKWVVANYELIDYHGDKCLLIGATDITEMKKLEKELLKYATTDMLTGTLNRRSGIKYLQEMIKKAETNQLPFVVCYIDINCLKQVNDKYGHSEGDYYIIKVCSIIQDNLDESDVLFRMGGDEFLIVFPNKHENEAELFWQKVLSELNSFKEKPYALTASHGLFEYIPGSNISLEEIVNYSDFQMYKEKSNYKEQ